MESLVITLPFRTELGSFLSHFYLYPVLKLITPPHLAAKNAGKCISSLVLNN